MQILNKLLTLVLLALFVGVGYQFYAKIQPIDSTELLPEINREPFYEEHLRVAEELIYAGEKYNAQPLANYEVWGVVVADDKTRMPIDMKKIRGAAQLRNLCVVWGDNLKADIYEHTRFRLRPWRCTPLGEKAGEVNRAQLQHLHLIASEDDVAEQASALHLGDQIRLKGYLANYNNESTGFSAQTGAGYDSETGENTRILLVEEVDLLREGHREENLFYESGKKLLLIILVLKIIFSIMTANHEVRRLDDERF